MGPRNMLRRALTMRTAQVGRASEAADSMMASLDGAGRSAVLNCSHSRMPGAERGSSGTAGHKI